MESCRRVPEELPPERQDQQEIVTGARRHRWGRSRHRRDVRLTLKAQDRLPRETRIPEGEGAAGDGTTELTGLWSQRDSDGEGLWVPHCGLCAPPHSLLS